MTWRWRSCHGKSSAALGLEATSRPLRDSRLVNSTNPRSSTPLSSTVRALGRPSRVAVASTKAYRFEGPEGELGLLDLFEGRRQLIVKHFMFGPEEDPCPSCTAGSDEIADGLLSHLHARETTLAHVSRGPLAQLERYKA